MYNTLHKTDGRRSRISLRRIIVGRIVILRTACDVSEVHRNAGSI